MREVASTKYRGGLPDDYDPEKGLKVVAVAEAAEIHFARAKDGSKLYEAVEAKLGEQRRFVLWWDGQEKRKATPGNLGPSVVGDGPAAEDFGLDRDNIHRWRKRLKEPRKFDAALEAAQERCIKVCEARQGQSDYAKATNTGDNEWYTPTKYLDLARTVLGAFDLDPASSNKAQERVGAAGYFTLSDDGLKNEWQGRVWLNPPYAQPYIAEFVSKLVMEWRAGHVDAAILLTHNYTDTAWFHEAAGNCDAICFTRGRIKFIHGKKGEVASPAQGQAFFYYGSDVSAFHEVFSDIGFVVVPK